MAQAFILRRGGSGVADLTMIGSQTCPATPNPNTLWLYTQTALKRMVIQPAQPTTLEGGAAAGDVWLRSGGGGPFVLPFSFAAVNAEGHDIPSAVRTVRFDTPEKELTVTGLPEPAFLSVNRNAGFYGTCTDLSATPEQLRATRRTYR